MTDWYWILPKRPAESATLSGLPFEDEITIEYVICRWLERWYQGRGRKMVGQVNRRSDKMCGMGVWSAEILPHKFLTGYNYFSADLGKLENLYW